jgi:hypothetical protein
MKDSRFDHEGACSHFTVHRRLGLHRSKLQLLNAGSLELGKESLQYRLNVAQEENRSERVTLLDPDVMLDDDRIAIVMIDVI